MSANSTVRVASVKASTVKTVGILPYGNVGEDHPLVRTLIERIEKAGCHADLLRYVDAKTACGVCVVTSRVGKDLAEALKPLHRRHEVRVYTTFDINKLKSVYDRLGVGEWARKKDHFLWVPADLSNWRLPFQGKTRLSERRAQQLGFLDSALQPVLLSEEEKEAAGRDTRVLARGDWWVEVGLKGLVLSELPPEWIQWILSERYDKLDDQVREALVYATGQRWYQESIEVLLRAKDARDGEREGGFCIQTDSKSQQASSFTNPVGDLYELWENYGVQKTPLWLPATRSEKQEFRDEWKVVRSAYENVGGQYVPRLLFEDQGIKYPGRETDVPEEAKVDDDDRLGLWYWAWKYGLKVLNRMERVQDLSELQSLLECFMSKKSLDFIAYDEEGELHVQKDKYVLWTRMPQVNWVDPDTQEEWSEADPKFVELVLDTYGRNCDRINRKEELQSEREDAQWILLDDGNGEMQCGLKVRRRGGVVRRVDRHPLQAKVDRSAALLRQSLKDVDRAIKANWNRPVTKLDESEVLGAVAEAMKVAERQQ